MNEKFCLSIIHHILQDEIEMFVMHPLPPTTQRTCHHLYEVNTSAIREISNHGGGTLIGGKTTTSEIYPASHLFVCCIESLSIVICQIGLLLQVFGQALGSTSWLQGVVLSFAKKVWGAHLRVSHKTNHASSKVVTSNWIKSVPTCIGHVDGTSGLSIQYYFLIPPTNESNHLHKTKTCDGLV